jgi:hypothetical protein
VIGNTPDFTVPGFLNSANEVFGTAHAVTIGNIMIFSRFPDLRYVNDWHWLLHEMRHIDQYMSFSAEALESIDGFAVDYIQNYKSMEHDADAAADAMLAAMQRRYAFTR